MHSVLIIDDNRISADAIAELNVWNELNCRIVGVCYDSETGKEAITKYRPDILLCDIKMPGDSGLDLMEKLRAELEGSCVIFMSAYDKFAYAQQAVRLGAHYYLLKPFSAEELSDAVLSAIDKLSSRGSAGDDEDVNLSEGEEPVNEIVKPIIAYMESHIDEHLNAEDIAAMFRMSTSKLDKTFKKHFGRGYREVRISLRIKKAKKLLMDIRYGVEEVAIKVGYKNYASFYRAFIRECGISPTDYRNPMLRGTGAEAGESDEDK